MPREGMVASCPVSSQMPSPSSTGCSSRTIPRLLPQRLQVPGRAEVAKVATGVSASAKLFERAAREHADLLVVHHGIFWGSTPGPIDAR